MGGAIPQLTPYSCMAYTGTNYLYFGVKYGCKLEFLEKVYGKTAISVL